MTLEELLKQQGLNDEQIKSIKDEMTKNKMFLSSEENLDIRYKKLKDEFDGLNQKNSESTKLIEDLKKSANGNEDLQAKINEYQTTVEKLETQLKKEKIENQLKVDLMKANANDLDYLMFKLKEKELSLDEDGKIKGIDDMIKGLKTSYPNQFEVKEDKKIDEHKLDTDKPNDPKISKEEFSKMGYQSRMKLKNDDPEMYADLVNSKGE